MNLECPWRHRIQCELHVEVVSRKMCSTLETEPRRRFQTYKHWLSCKNRKNVYKNLTANSLRKERQRENTRAARAVRNCQSNFLTNRARLFIAISLLSARWRWRRFRHTHHRLLLLLLLSIVLRSRRCSVLCMGIDGRREKFEFDWKYSRKK